MGLAVGAIRAERGIKGFCLSSSAAPLFFQHKSIQGFDVVFPR
jgi:hypothetical protein